MQERSIIHLNVADFAVAVERVVDSRLQDRPVIIAPEGAARAAVYDMSEEAYQCGVRKGMALRRALRYCREAAVLPPHPDRYERAMTGFLKHALPYSPLIEMTDHKGHLFIDVTGTGRLFGPPPDLAVRIRRAVRRDLGFDPIWSVATNKLVAKAASRTVKPDGESVVPPGNEASFLAPLPLHLIPGIESEDLGRLREFNLVNAGQVARLSAVQLAVAFGRRNWELYDAVRGVDPSPVLPAGQNTSGRPGRACVRQRHQRYDRCGRDSLPTGGTGRRRSALSPPGRTAGRDRCSTTPTARVWCARQPCDRQPPVIHACSLRPEQHSTARGRVASGFGTCGWFATA